MMIERGNLIFGTQGVHARGLVLIAVGAGLLASGAQAANAMASPADRPASPGAVQPDLRRVDEKAFRAALVGRDLVSEFPGVVPHHPFIEAFCSDGRYFRSFGAQPIQGRWVMRQAAVCSRTDDAAGQDFCRVIYSDHAGDHYWRRAGFSSAEAAGGPPARFKSSTTELARACGRPSPVK